MSTQFPPGGPAGPNSPPPFDPSFGPNGPPQSSGSTTLIIIIVVAVVGLLMCGGIAMSLLLPAVQQVRAHARQLQSGNNMREISMTLLNKSEGEGILPSVLVHPETGQEYSWRVAILPSLGYKDLYDRYDFSEPWDGPNNRQLIDLMPEIYQNPALPASNTSAYYLVVGPGTTGENRDERLTLQELSNADGASQTLCLVEADLGVPWTQPRDYEVSPNADVPPLGSEVYRGAHVAFWDGSVMHISDLEGKDELIRQLATYDGGEPADPNQLR